MSEQEREHVLSMDCWCGPVKDSYGHDLVSDIDVTVPGGVHDDEREEP